MLFGHAAALQAMERSRRQLRLDLEHAVARSGENVRPDNTRRAYSSKREELKQYCRALYPHQENPYYITEEKVFTFLWYQAHREKRRSGRAATGRRQRDEQEYDDAAGCFNLQDFTVVSNPGSRIVILRFFVPLSWCQELCQPNCLLCSSCVSRSNCVHCSWTAWHVRRWNTLICMARSLCIFIIDTTMYLYN
jgi:hypothetical protein